MLRSSVVMLKKVFYLQEELLPGCADLKLALVPLHVVHETGIANIYVSEGKGVLGRFEVIQVTFSRIVHEPAQLVPPERPLARQLVQVAAQFGGLLPPAVDVGHVHGLDGRQTRGRAGV